MWKKLLSAFLTAALLCSMMCMSAFAEVYGESYVFRLSDPRDTEELTEKAEALCVGTGLYRTDSYALIQKLECAGALAQWDVDCEVALDGAAEEVQSRRATDYRAAMLGYDYIQEKNITGQGVKVGIIDSGLWSGFSEKTQATILEGVNVLAEKGSEERSNTEDTLGHGTFVTSIICGEDIGLAPKVSILPLKCFSGKTTAVSYIVAALDEAIAQGCDVVNLSVGGTDKNEVLEQALETALDAGIIIVAAGGNLSGTSTGEDALYYPAAYDGVLGVGSLDSTKTVSSKSAQNAGIFVAAPGVKVKGINLKGKIATGSGTSYAAPVVTALAALALSVAPELTREGFAALLAETAEDLGTEGRDNSYGHGLINPALLLAALLEDSESMVLTAWEDGSQSGALGLSMWLSPDNGSHLLACYESSGKLQKLIFPKSLCCFVLENDPYRLSLFSLGDGYRPLTASRTLYLHKTD